MKKMITIFIPFKFQIVMNLITTYIFSKNKKIKNKYFRLCIRNFTKFNSNSGKFISNNNFKINTSNENII